jgi:hypothetical protein
MKNWAPKSLLAVFLAVNAFEAVDGGISGYDMSRENFAVENGTAYLSGRSRVEPLRHVMNGIAEVSKKFGASDTTADDIGRDIAKAIFYTGFTGVVAGIIAGDAAWNMQAPPVWSSSPSL